LHSSAILLHASLISRLICITTASMLRRTTTLPLDHAFGFELADIGPGCNRGAAPVPTR
jgi:hypothetical protein